MHPIRIGIVGARRHAQGIGQYVARDLAAAGGDVRAIVGTRRETVEQARRALADRHGLTVRGYLDLAEMIQSESLEAVAICSPYPLHREHLLTALNLRQHVLCEKPLIFDPGRDNVADAQPLVEAFAEAGRVLMVNQQWPCTLPAFDRCYPLARGRGTALRQFAMLLAPSEDGIDMIPNALPHVFSMLLALSPASGSLKDLRFERRRAGELAIHFNFVQQSGSVEVSVYLRQVPQQPRPAGYAINGCGVWRRIELPSYRMSFVPAAGELSDAVGQTAEAGEPGTESAARVELEDPLRLLANEFIRRVGFADSPQSVDPMLIENVRLVQDVYQSSSGAFAP